MLTQQEFESQIAFTGSTKLTESGTYFTAEGAGWSLQAVKATGTWNIDFNEVGFLEGFSSAAIAWDAAIAALASIRWEEK
jgi:hypothetical protein